MIKLLLNASTKQKDKAIIVGATVDTQTHKNIHMVVE